MKKPVMNIMGFALISLIISIIAVTSVKSGNDKVSSSNDDPNPNRSDEHNIASICSRIDRLSESVNEIKPQSASVNSITYSNHPDLDRDFGELETEEMSDEYLADYYPSKVSKEYSDKNKNVIDDYENTDDIEE